MIKGKLKIELTIEEILKRISYYDIYRKYVGNFIINHAMCNSFRKDDNPSFIIGNRYGNLSHMDFGDTYWRGDAINLVEQINGCTYDEALKIIDRDFCLGISSGTTGTEYKKITSQYKQPEEAGKRYSLIQVVTRKFTNDELKYWSQYFQTVDDLRANNIYSIKEVYLNRRRFSIPDSELRFGYLYEGGWWKIYRPCATKKSKWISNVPVSVAYGLNNLNKEHNSLITKSMKDYLICKKIYPYVCHVQNESLASFSKEAVEYINNNSKNVFLGFDSDVPGKSASWIVTKAFGWKHINPPDRLLPESNDFADWGKKEGLDKLEEHFKIKKLID